MQIILIFIFVHLQIIMVGVAALKVPMPAVANTGKSAMRSRRVAVSCRAQIHESSFDSIKRRAAAVSG